MGNLFSNNSNSNSDPFKSDSQPRSQIVRTFSNYDDINPYTSSSLYNERRLTSSSYRSNSSVQNMNRHYLTTSNNTRNSSLYDTNERQSNLFNSRYNNQSIRSSRRSFDPEINNRNPLRNLSLNSTTATTTTTTRQAVKPNTQHNRQRRSNQKQKQLSQPVLRLLKLVYINHEFLYDDQRIAFYYYKNLNTKLRLMEPNEEEYDTICKYLKNTHGPTHKFKLTIENIYVSYRLGAFRDFKENKKLGNRKMLWHGTKLSNYPSILSNGLLTEPPSDTETNGKMFGNGIYFADVVTKAAQYCKVDRYNPYGILILAQVALGKQYIKTESEHIKSLPVGKNSVKALGRYQPSESIRNKYGIEIPLGRPTLQPNLKSKLYYNEYIVYDMNQIFFEYLVLVKFDY